MKFVFLFAILGVASAGYAPHLTGLYGMGPAYVATAPVVQKALINTGHSAQFREQDSNGNYAFAYNEDHSTGGTFRRESGNAHGQVIGSYGLRDRDGRIRIANYIADDDGFRVSLQSNEPGVASADSAHATVNKPVVPVPGGLAPTGPVITPVASAPAVVAAAPIVAAPAPAPAVVVRPVASAPAVAVSAPIPAYRYAMVNHAPLTHLGPVARAIVAQQPAYINVAPDQTYSQTISSPPVIARGPPVLAQPVAEIPTPIVKSPVAYAAPIHAQVPIRAPIAAAYTAPLPVAKTIVASAGPSITYAPALRGPVDSGYVPVNSYVHPAAYGFTLGMPASFGYTYVKK